MSDDDDWVDAGLAQIMYNKKTGHVRMRMPVFQMDLTNIEIDICAHKAEFNDGKISKIVHDGKDGYFLEVKK